MSSAVVTVETTSRWEMSSLLRKLRGHSAYAIQVEPDLWLVLSPIPASGRAEIDALVTEWAKEERLLWPPGRAGAGGTGARPPE